MLIENEIKQGDCTTVLRTMPDKSVDLVVTDPPYLVSYRSRDGRAVLNDDCPENVLSCFPDLYRVLKPDSLCVCFYGWGKVDAFFDAWTGAGFRPVGHIVWAKNYASHTGHLKACHEQAFLLAKGYPPKPQTPIRDVQPWEYTGNNLHPTQKAISVFRPLIEAFSAPGDLVLDPFAGSGSACVAAARAGRRYIGIELEARYCDVARERLADPHYFQRAA
jgi:site-specific DNA-methyltransferase (adenine-specific)